MTGSAVTEIAALPCRARKTRVSGGEADIYALAKLLGGFSIVFILFFVNPGLKHCVCNAVSPWSQSSSPDSQRMVINGQLQ